MYWTDGQSVAKVMTPWVGYSFRHVPDIASPVLSRETGVYSLSIGQVWHS